MWLQEFKKEKDSPKPRKKSTGGYTFSPYCYCYMQTKQNQKYDDMDITHKTSIILNWTPHSSYHGFTNQSHTKNKRHPHSLCIETNDGTSNRSFFRGQVLATTITIIIINRG